MYTDALLAVLSQMILLIFQRKSHQVSETSSSEQEVRLVDLEPYTTYNISVACRSTLGGFWSDAMSIQQRTLPTGDHFPFS